jgi:hypothetical protein
MVSCNYFWKGLTEIPTKRGGDMKWGTQTHTYLMQVHFYTWIGYETIISVVLSLTRTIHRDRYNEGNLSLCIQWTWCQHYTGNWRHHNRPEICITSHDNCLYPTMYNEYKSCCSWKVHITSHSVEGCVHKATMFIATVLFRDEECFTCSEMVT